MATAISEIDLYTALRDKLGDTETRDLIEYVKTTRQEAKDEIKADKLLATKDNIAALRAAGKDDIAALRVDIANLKTEIKRRLKEQLKWLVVLLMGFSSLITTVIKLL